MAAFASDRRAGWVRVLVLIMCALFIFAVLAAPPAYAVGETVALFTAAAVLSSAVAALGFKLSTDAEGQATLSKMVEDFAKVSWATGLVIVGSRVNGLINGLNYIKMAVHNGKTYLDERVIAWCQQWLSDHGVYDESSVTYPNYVVGQSVSFQGISFSDVLATLDPVSASLASDLVNHYNIDLSSTLFQVEGQPLNNRVDLRVVPSVVFMTSTVRQPYDGVYTTGFISDSCYYYTLINGVYSDNGLNYRLGYAYLTPWRTSSVSVMSNYGLVYVSGNDTGLSGTDTLGEDYVNKTLEQILAGLKEWAQDWYDAGADSATNEASGALDLPLTVTDGAATANPALNPDVVYNPPFSLPWPDVRSGETSSSTTEAGQANADAAQTATADVAENQTIVDSLVTWALGYISPDTGLFSKFPLCIPYDAYLIVCSALGVDAVDPSIVYGAEPGDLAGVVTSGTSTYSDFQPIIHLEHDFELDGRTYPLEITIDLTPWQPLVDLAREGIAILFMAELIASEYRRIKGH